MKTKNLTIAAIVAVIAIVGLLNIANAVPGAGRSGNPPGVQPATELQNLVDCCQTQATVAEYQDNAATNQVMGTCTKAGIEAFRTGGLPALQGYISSTCGGACTSDADCDDGNSCTTEFCSTGLRRGCITGIPVGDGQSCFLDGAVGVCVGSQCTIPCVEVSPEQIHSGACKDFSFIDGENLPQCCSLEGGPSGDLLCGTEEEWVVGVTAFPICYIPGS